MTCQLRFLLDTSLLRPSGRASCSCLHHLVEALLPIFHPHGAGFPGDGTPPPQTGDCHLAARVALSQRIGRSSPQSVGLVALAKDCAGCQGNSVSSGSLQGWLFLPMCISDAPFWPKFSLNLWGFCWEPDPVPLHVNWGWGPQTRQGPNSETAVPWGRRGPCSSWGIWACV